MISDSRGLLLGLPIQEFLEYVGRKSKCWGRRKRVGRRRSECGQMFERDQQRNERRHVDGE